MVWRFFPASRSPDALWGFVATLGRVHLHELVATSEALRRTRSRREKVARLAATLRALTPDEVPHGVSWLGGGIRHGRIGVAWRGLRGVEEGKPATEASLTVAQVVEAFDALAAADGPGSARRRRELLGRLFARATAAERDFLERLLVGELRQGANEGLVVEAVAQAAGVALPSVRRAHMVSGDLGAVASAALAGGEPALAPFRLELFRPLLPMLASPAADVADALARLGRAAFEWKLDGVRVQVHKQGSEARLYSRRLHELSAAAPELVAWARALPAERLILDVEALALAPGGAPHPFQVTMRRFGRRLDVDTMRRELPLAPFAFDVLHLDGEDLLDASTERRAQALAHAVPEPGRVPRLVTGDEDAAEAFYDAALARGHEGLMAKALDAPYAAGGRGRSWLKVKPAHTLDLVVLAAEWGSGRRRGWLSNLHLGARDPATGGFVMLGKTFKGMTDALLAWQTEALLAREVARDESTVHVRPDLVVEVALSGIQESPHYPAGMALRFARVRRYRPDKTPEEADTLETVRRIHGGPAPQGRAWGSLRP